MGMNALGSAMCNMVTCELNAALLSSNSYDENLYVMFNENERRHLARHECQSDQIKTIFFNISF